MRSLGSCPENCLNYNLAPTIIIYAAFSHYIYIIFLYHMTGSREYYNGELKEGANYAVFQRSFDEYGSYETENFIHFTTKKSSRTAVIIVSVVLVVPLLLILLVFSVDAGCRYISKGD